MSRPTGPSKLTPELLEALTGQLKQGIPRKYAAAYVGIHRSTLHAWETHGKHARAKLAEGGELTPDEQLFLDAADQIELAADYGVAHLVHQILEAAGGDKAHLKKWQAYMTVLERTQPQDFRRRTSSEYIERDRNGKTRTIDVSTLNREERAVLRSLLQKASPDGD